MLRKLYLLLWKNQLYFKRHYIRTAVEVILPCLVVIALASLKSQNVHENEDSDKNITTENKADIVYPEKNEADFLRPLVYKFGLFPEEKNLILYTPKSEAAERIIAKLVDKIDQWYYPEPDNKTWHITANITDFPNEDKMVKFNSMKQLRILQRFRLLGNLREVFKIPFGLVFDGLSGNEVGPKVSYKIRLSLKDEGDYLDTKALIHPTFIPGYHLDPAPDRYISSGFIGLQYLLDQILIEEYTNETVRHTLSLQGFPYPRYKKANRDIGFSDALSVFLVTGFVFIVPQVIRGVVSEKETGIKELMKMSGLPEWMHWFGWMLNSLAILTLVVIIIVFILVHPFNPRSGALYEHSNPTLVWTVLMIYMIWAITFCFLVAACFEKSSLATTFGIIIWLVSFYGLGFGMQNYYGKNYSSGVKLLFCLLPNVAIHLALMAIGDFELTEIGSQLGNIDQTVTGRSNVPLLNVILMFLASICLNMIMCLYIEAVFPKTYGVRKPFYFLLLPSKWGFSNRVSPSPLLNDNTSTSNNKPQFEDDPSGIKVGVQIKNLRKEFENGKVAVNDLTLNIFEGQIFCLLGQNGAGKTTTMSILAGIISPTSGTAFINGYDIRTNMNEIRKNLGLCPQHNMLFDDMTVIEHLKFFGMLKGLSSKNAEMEGEDLVDVLKMEDKRNVLSKNLSGGQKRRLSLGCAIIGGSKVIFLDEPTSGLDPEARRAIWDILLRIRGKRTIVLTTHFMEEADVLGDRIGILANGSLQCCGTPNFLKRFYGAGFTLNMTTMDGAHQDKILLTVCKHIEDAYFKTSHSNNSTEVSIVLPSDSNTTAKFPDLFSELRKDQEKLHIDEIGVGWTTMDEVFVRVEELNHEEEDTNNGPTTAHQNGTSPLNEFGPNHNKLTGLKLTISQFYGLLLKKLFHTMRQNRRVIIQMLLPVLLTIAAIFLGFPYKDSEENPGLKMSLSSYQRPVTLYSSESKGLGDNYAKVVGSSAQLVDSSYNNNISLGLFAAGLKDLNDYKARYIVAAELNDTNMKGMYSILAYHSPSLSLNLLTNTFIHSKGKGGKVETINHPFPDENKHMPFTNIPTELDLKSAFIIAVLLPLGLTLLLASFIVGPTEERISKGKHLQLMTGVSPLLYWSPSFLCDMLLALISISLMTACLPIFEQGKMFTDQDGAGILFLIMTAYAFASIPFSYIFSTFVSGVAEGFSLITIINIAAGVGLGIASFYQETVNQVANPDKGLSIFLLRMIGRLFPSFGVTKASLDYAETANYNGLCYRTPKKSLDYFCDPKVDFSWLYFNVSRKCCANCAAFDDCFEPRSYFRWTKAKTREYSGETKTFYIPALNEDLLWLVLMGVVYFVILILIEYGVFQRNSKRKQSVFESTVDDNDVLEENERVNQLVMTATSSEDAMVVHNLCKSFGSFSAVSELSFGVHHGECFGLLGVNGAGKTTTFRMLTGDENRSSGNAYMNNLSLSSKRKRFLSTLGYCPQFDGFVGVLSGKEMLHLFSRLRGIPGNRVEEEADRWLQQTGLTASANVQCRKYSGGMKRRLSTAMAFIGDPAVILLDEPTSGVDPVARRQFWKIISSIKNSGQAIILTSHSMEECEALCSRLGIMVKGELQCLGGVQHLKNKFAQGYSLTLKLTEDAVQDEEFVEAITDSILQNFQPSSLIDHHQTTMKFQIHSQAFSWEELYGRMERIKTDFQELIEEYAITETTLEEVFLSFART